MVAAPPADLADDNRAAIAQITGRCPELKATRALVREFADMLCHRHGDRLEAWAVVTGRAAVRCGGALRADRRLMTVTGYHLSCDAWLPRTRDAR